MKTFGTFLLLLLSVAPAAAQSEAPKGAGAPEAPAAAGAPETHGLSVVKATWRKRYYNPALDEDPLRGANDAIHLDRARREAQRTNTIRSAQGRGPRPLPTQTVEGVLADSVVVEARDYYVYEVKVLNTGTKKIKLLVWEYVLLDPETQREVGRHSFETKAGIALGKGKTLIGWSTVPPASVVDARKPEGEPKQSSARFTERVDIRRVVYDDGAVWERPREK